MKNTMPSIIKTKTTEYVINKVYTNFCMFDAEYRRIREKYKYTGYTCYNCNKHFVDGDIVNVLQTNRGNKVSCSSCADKFKKELNNE